MIVDLTLLECAYIAATTRFFRNALRQEDQETMMQIADEIMALENEQIGQALLLKLQGYLIQEDERDGARYYQ
ncbi:MAG: hypothetical protein WC444_07560 [Candidatus Paceibacterota bacterium]|jgi:hypothetical protein